MAIIRPDFSGAGREAGSRRADSAPAIQGAKAAPPARSGGTQAQVTVSGQQAPG
jgi:hypothetical protein